MKGTRVDHSLWRDLYKDSKKCIKYHFTMSDRSTRKDKKRRREDEDRPPKRTVVAETEDPGRQDPSKKDDRMGECGHWGLSFVMDV